MQLGKFSSDRDSVLHFLCSIDWANDSTGDVETMGKYVWRISLAEADVQPNNTEFQSVIEDWFTDNPEVQDTPEFRRSLIGDFLVQEFSNGHVLVLEYETEEYLTRAFNLFETEYENIWADDSDTDDSEESVHFRRNGESGHQW